MPDIKRSSMTGSDEFINIKGPNGRTVRMLLLHQLVKAEYIVSIFISANFMKVFLSLERKKGTALPSVEMLHQTLRELKIVVGVDTEALRLFLVNLDRGEDPGLFQVAKGVPVQHGRDGTMEFHVLPTSREARYEMDDAGNIDYRNLNLVQSALKDQHVATFHQPTQGVSGQDVFGNILPAKPGEAMSVRLGQGIRFCPDTSRFFAELDGRLEFERNRLSLFTKYEVKGNVDYSVGSIDFVGEVVIFGNVLDEFNVTGKKGVRVEGMVGNCNIQSDNDVFIRGGVTGKGGGRITAGGKVNARYLHEVVVEAGGDVEVQNEIVNSEIRSNGKVLIPTGTILAGSVMAFSGVETGAIGSDLGIKTSVAAGLDWTTECKLTDIEYFLEQQDGRLIKIDTLMLPILEDKIRLLALPTEQKEFLHLLLDRLCNLRDHILDEQNKIDTLNESKQTGRKCQINVHNMVHEGATIRFPENQLVVKEQLRGPLSFVEDPKAGLVRRVPYSKFKES